MRNCAGAWREKVYSSRIEEKNMNNDLWGVGKGGEGQAACPAISSAPPELNPPRTR
eukprot:m.440147 g.440147  ORF g.440147 m.440147 type:complete len:56 (+) comp123301_c0_seq1:120-287(+)